MSVNKRTLRVFPSLWISLCIFMNASCGLYKVSENSDDFGCAFNSEFEPLTDYLQTHIVVFGETHGSIEGADIFSDFMCHVAYKGIALQIGLELDAQDTQYFNDFVNGEIDELSMFQESTSWKVHDGTTSTGILDILKTASQIKKAEGDIFVYGMNAKTDQMDWSTPQSTFNSANLLRSKTIETHAKNFHGAIFILTGRAHAKNLPTDYDGQIYTPIAHFMKSRPVLSLQMAHPEGKIWIFMQSETFA